MASMRFRRQLDRSRSGSKPRALGGIGLALFGLPFFAAGIFLSGLYFKGYADWLDAARWEEAPCWITEAELVGSRSSDGSSHRATAKYHYRHRGRMFEGDQVSLYSGSDNIGGFQKRAYRELRQYAKPFDPNAPPSFRCYVNPKNPAEAVIYRDLRWEMQAFMSIFALTFPAVGAGLLAGGLLAARSARRLKTAALQHPDEPWRQIPQWSGETIPESSSPWRAGIFAYTLWSALIIGPLLWAAARSGAFDSLWPGGLLLIFPALWSFPASYTLRALRHRMTAGRTSVRISDPLPLRPGRPVRGNIALRRPLSTLQHAELELTCKRSITRGSGDSQTTERETLWSETLQVRADQLGRDDHGHFLLPFTFDLPADAPASSLTDVPMGEANHEWRLSWKVPGTPMRSEYALPVIPDPSLPPLPSAGPLAAPAIEDSADARVPEALAASRIQAEFDAAGLPISLTCPPSRHLGTIAFLVFFDLIWTAAAVFLIQQNAPLLFRIVWPVSATVIWLVIFWMALHHLRVEVSAGSITLRHRLGPFRWLKSHEKSSIAEFLADSNMQSGNTRYYRIRLRTLNGRHATLVSGLKGASAAEALARRFETWRSQA